MCALIINAAVVSFEEIFFFSLCFVAFYACIFTICALCGRQLVCGKETRNGDVRNEAKCAKTKTTTKTKMTKTHETRRKYVYACSVDSTRVN